MFAFLIFVVVAWIALSLAIGAYHYATNWQDKKVAVQAVVDMLTLPYHSVKMLIAMFRK